MAIGVVETGGRPPIQKEDAWARANSYIYTYTPYTHMYIHKGMLATRVWRQAPVGTGATPAPPVQQRQPSVKASPYISIHIHHIYIYIYISIHIYV